MTSVPSLRLPLSAIRLEAAPYEGVVGYNKDRLAILVCGGRDATLGASPLLRSPPQRRANDRSTRGSGCGPAAGPSSVHKSRVSVIDASLSAATAARTETKVLRPSLHHANPEPALPANGDAMPPRYVQS